MSVGHGAMDSGPCGSQPAGADVLNDPIEVLLHGVSQEQ
jgi:hypothetical protein